MDTSQHTDKLSAVEGLVGNATERSQVHHEEVERAALVQNNAEAAQAKLDQILSSITDGFATLDPAWRFVYLNDAAVHMSVGKSAKEDFLGKSFSEVFPEALETPFGEALRRVMHERKALQLEYFYPLWNRWFENRIYPTGDGLSFFVSDITERKRAEERLHHLQEVTTSFAEAQTLEQMRHIIFDEVLRALGADAGALRRVTDQGLVVDEHERAAHTHADDRCHYASVPSDARHPAIDVARSGEALFIQDVEELILRYPDLAETAAQQKTQAAAHLPLTRGTEVFLVLSLSFSEPRHWDEAERNFALALVGRAAVALERARLFEAERRAREQSERLQAVTARLSTALAPADVVRVVLDEGLPAMGAIAGLVVQLEGQDLQLVKATGYPEELVRPWQGFLLSANTPVAEAARTGESVWVESQGAFAQRFGRLPDPAALAITQSWVALPLITYGRVLGALGFSYGEPQSFDLDRRRFAETLADLCAQALERSRLFVAERDARARLEETGLLLQQALEAAQMVAWDAAEGRLTLSPNAARLLGSEVALARTPALGAASVHPADLDAKLEDFRKALKSRTDYHSVYRFLHSDRGEWLWLEDHGHVRYDGDKPLGISGVTQDITERKRTELHAQFLIELDAALGQLAEPAAIEQAAIERVGAFLQVERSYFAQHDGTHVTVHQEWPHGGVSSIGTYDLDDFFGAAPNFTSGQDIVVHDVMTDPRTSPLQANYAALGIAAFLCTPILHNSRWVGTLNVISHLPRVWREDELRLLRDVVVRVWPRIERARVEAALRESEAQQRLITDGMPALVSYVDRERRYQFVNKTYVEWFGRTAEQMRGKHLWEVLGTPAYEVAKPAIDRVLDGQHVTFEQLVPYKDGGTRYVQASYIPDRGPAGEIRGYFALVVDLSERKRVEEALRVSEEKYRALTELSLHMVWTLGPEGDINYLSQKWFDYTGLTFEEVRQSGWLRALHPDEREQIGTDFQRYLARGTEYTMELRLKGRDDSYRWHLTRATPITGEENEVVRWLGVTFDIDERKRAEEALRASEERYRSLTNILTSLVWQTDAAGSFVVPQPEWAAFTGQTWEEHSGWGWVDALHPDDRDHLVQVWRQALAERSVYEAYGRVWYAPGNEYRHFRTRAVPLHQSDGSIREWIGTLTDTHDQEMRERDARFLADLAERLRLAEDADALMWDVVQLVGAYMQVARCFFADVNEALHHKVVHRDYRSAPHLRSLAGIYELAKYPPPVAAAMRAGRIMHIGDTASDPLTAELHTAIYKPLGTQAFVTVPLLRENQWVAVIVAFSESPRAWQSREIALLETVAERVWLAVEKLRAEQALHAYAEQLLRLNAASVAINAATTLHDVLHQITERARDLVGAHQSVTSLTVNEQWQQAITTVSLSDKYAAWRSYNAPTNGTGIYALVCATNTPLRLTQAELEAHPAWRGFGAAAASHPPMRGWLAVPLTTPDGRNIGLIQLSDKEAGEFSATDEAVLLQLAQLASVAIENARLYAAAQDAILVRDQFLSVAAHELKTPLTSLLGYSQTLLRRVVREASLGERDQRTLRQTTDQALRLNRLIDALLDVGRIEAGRLSIERQPMDVSVLLRRIVEAAQTTLEQHSVELVGAEGPLVIGGDELRLEQVIQNLLSNAVKYSPNGGTIRLALTEHEAAVTIAVHDQGIGIPQAAIPQLFDRFYRVDGAEARHISGMGIGLYVVKEIVGLHDGTVTVESVEGVGSTFVVTLPHANALPNSVAAPLNAT